MKKLLAIFTSAALLLIASTASAMPIDGSIKFFGVANTTTAAGVVTSITFQSQLVGVVSGDFSIVTPLIPNDVSFTDLNPVAPTSSLWSVGIFTFDLMNVVTNTVSNAGAVEVSGTGLVKATGFDDTMFSWLYTAQAGNDQTFSASSIPAPAGTALLGLTLLAFGLSRRNKKA